MPNPPLSLAKLRALGLTLRTLRKRAGLRLTDLETMLPSSSSTLSRLEKGEAFPSGFPLAKMLKAVGASEQEAAEALELAADVRQPNWTAIGAGLSLQTATYLEFESEASRVTSVSLALIPGLLQTQEYAEAVLREAQVSVQDLEARLQIRMQRQQILNRGIRYTAIIDEMVLRRPLGDCAVACRQLQYLLACIERPNIAIHVLPAALIAAAGGSYVLLEFDRLKPVVHVEAALTGTILDEAAAVDLLAITTRLRELALGRDDSAALIMHTMREMESQ